MGVFKVGDRVRVRNRDAYGNGTIHAIEDSAVLVAFDSWTDGHNGGGKLKDDNGWWFTPLQLELTPTNDKWDYDPRQTAGYTFPVGLEDGPADDMGEPDAPLTCAITCDTSEMDAAIDRVLRRIKKLRKKARKAGIRLGVSELQDAA